MRENDKLGPDDTLASRAGGGAAVGAGFGGLIGAVIGWILGAQVTPTPQIGPVVGQWVLPSTLVGLLAGVAIGALIGALAAVSTTGRTRNISQPRLARGVADEPAEYNHAAIAPRHHAPVEESASAAEEVAALPVAQVAEQPPSPVTTKRRSRPRAVISRVASPETSTTAQLENDGPLHASTLPDVAHTTNATEAQTEVTEVSDEQKGRDSNAFTGTRDAVDPETGALGTAGTPVTTGYGVSGSTIGTGSRRRQRKEEKGDYRGATPDTASYDIGGRGTGDSGVLRSSERAQPVEDRNTDAGLVEASIPRDPARKDVYEQSEGYAESLKRDVVPPPPSTGANESSGTNIPGTEDPRGLGDNTDRS